MGKANWLANLFSRLASHKDKIGLHVVATAKTSPGEMRDKIEQAKCWRSFIAHPGFQMLQEIMDKKAETSHRMLLNGEMTVEKYRGFVMAYTELIASITSALAEADKFQEAVERVP